MGLRLILGRAGSGKSELCLQEIAGKLKEEARGWPLLYLVPEQATFQAEYALVTLPGLEGAMRAQVLSFRRLAWRIMREVGGGKRVFIDDTGKGMILQKLMERSKGELKIFKSAGGKAGSLENLVQLYNELKRSQVSVFQLKEKFREKENTEESSPSLLFKEKLNDLVLILEKLEQELEGYYLDAEDYLALLALNIPRSAYLRGAEIWVDGFYSFTGQELQVLQELLKHCRRVNVTVCLERDCPPEEKVDELDPFYPAKLTCQKLIRVAENCGLPVEKEMLSPLDPPRFAASPALMHLEKYLHSYPAEPFPNAAGTLPLHLFSAPNRRAEVEGLARELIRLARDGGCRWREMAVLMGDLEQYRDLLAMVFTDYGIPFFLDQERSLLHHPLIEFIRSALEVINGNWRFDALFRCFKTEFPLPLEQSTPKRRRWRKRADRLENYVLAFGIQGYRWLQDGDWQYRLREGKGLEDGEGLQPDSFRERAALKLLNATRRRLSRPLLRFQESFKAASTVKEKTLALFGLLQEVGAGERLELWKKEALQRGAPEKARENDQVYDGVIGLMDQLVEIMGAEKISAALYARILEAGLKNLRLSLVPPALDQVLVGTVQRTRVGRIRFVFLAGVNDGVLPSRQGGGGVFSEAERETLTEWGLELPPGSRRRLLDEQFLTYMALTRASEGLSVSYSLADEEGRGLLPSSLIPRLKELFPGLQVLEMLPESPGMAAGGDFAAAGPENGSSGAGMEDPRQIFSAVAHPRKTLSQLLIQLGRYKKGEGLHPLWWDIYNWYADNSAWREPGIPLLRSVFYQNRAENLGEETSLQLYQKRIPASVSRLEKYSACPFSHYLAYGLRLKERRVYRLDNLDIGHFFHAALKNVVLSLQGKGLDLGALSGQESRQLTAAEVELLIPRLQQEILLSSSRYRYLAEKLKETVSQAVVYLGEQARRSSFRPAGVEVSFGPGSVLPPLLIKLENGCEVELRGRIDRVDLARDGDGNAYVTIIDYKSGNRDLNLAEFYHGLSLQMLVYLEVILAHAPSWLGEKVLPAGVFYFHVHAPLLRFPAIPSLEKIEAETLKRYKLKGRVLADPQAVALLDSELQSGYSKIIPVGLSPKKGFYKNSALLTEDHFALLRTHIYKLVQKIANEIIGGCVEIRPFRLGMKKACTHCPYTAVCQFDLLLEGNSYRILREGKQDLIWSWLEPAGKEEENEGGNGNGQQ
jgi:ATP-dependent helicase/nuclease subunit B